MSVPDDHRLDESEIDHLAALVATRRATRSPVTADECAEFRRRVRSGECATDVARDPDTDRSPPTVLHHARGDCSHDVDEPPR